MAIHPEVVGRIARQSIVSGTPITSADFASGNTAQGDQIVQSLKPGYRAISVRVDQDSGVGTLIQPGDRVDMVIGALIQEYLSAAPNSSALPQPIPGGPQLSSQGHHPEPRGPRNAHATGDHDRQAGSSRQSLPRPPVRAWGSRVSR